MIKPTQPQALSLASPLDIEQTARRLALMREAFLATGTTGATQPRSLIRDSWRRCLALAVDAERNLAQFGAPADHQLADLRERNAALRFAARPVLARLSTTLNDVGYVVALSDAEGTLIELGGSLEWRRRLARKGLLLGSNWSEAAAGTNAIGIALATRRVVQLLAAEHYCAGWQDVTCTAAPIPHPENGSIVGVLDITSDYRMVRPFLTGLLAVAALEVQRGYASALRTSSTPTCFVGVVLPATAGGAGALNELPDQAAAAERLIESKATRRAAAAERMAAAIGAISASLDLALTLETVAAQVGPALELPCAAAALFDGPDGPIARIWQPRSLSDERAGRAVAALLQSEALAPWCESNAPALFPELASLPPELASIMATAGLEALALFPLTTARGVLGLIVAMRRAPGPWAVDDVQLGLTLAAHAATALENARIFTSLRSYAVHTEALNALAAFLSTLLDPGRHLDLVLRQIAEITNLDAGLIFLRDAPDAPLLSVATQGFHSVGEGGAGEVPPSLRDLVETVDLTGQALLLCRQHEAEHEAAVLLATGFCDLALVPLTLINTGMGVLVVGSRRHRQVSREELTLFTTIAQQLGLALSNAHLRRAASENEALREADRLKSAFLGMVSHELRSPLTAIRASVEGLLDQEESVPLTVSEGLLQNIARQAIRLGRFVDQLLDLSCIEAGTLALDREWVEAGALLDDVLAAFGQRFQGCLIERAISPDLPLLYVDPTLATQVLWNLLENAQKYGPPEGPLRVEAFCTGEQVLINVADRGPGIELLDRAQIFNHFFRLERDRRAQVSGSGLGLALCQGIVAAHGGRIWVDERPGGGSVFRVALPLATPDLAALQGLDLAPLGQGQRDELPAMQGAP
jgi:two-component system sensor histidine kinase KdpD